MPQPGKRWRHVVISTHSSWLPGDPRGFRSQDHKIHSSGDYKNPPPPGEHAGLHQYSKTISAPAVVIPQECRAIVGGAILKKLQKLDCQVLAGAVAGMHAHFLVELPDDMPTINHVVGQCKTVASHAVREHLPGRVWGRGGKFLPVDDPEHQKNVYHYILRQEGAWTWSFRDGEKVNP